ncbi:beta-fructofuranosidase [Caloramator quimbayensis]|uniref:Sucrose-6-phosphate hydrolase n=1 Tax=Caloramator quimbayensis TaxID=1147123 RepID=A0A1T4Y009_9CLOT|nr:glycoside hydrolase family 32 protein [Caloramator quimbayensis]SKA95142.1 beta-fructofuranosidase [Caloramator quimbayensis]
MTEDMIVLAKKFIENNKTKVDSTYRLNYHLMGEYGWVNDPNGFIYFNGLYHLFYQHYPYEPIWGPMHWGHAVSSDLIKWEYMPLALAPDKVYDKDGCFSGSAIEKDNMMYLFYTGHVYNSDKKDDYKQTQCIAYSIDGINFSKYINNPVIGAEKIPQKSSKNDFRDPKIFVRGTNYYMVLGSNDGEGNGQALLYKSKDLINWDFVNILAKSDGNIGMGWECPDLFSIKDMDVLIVSPQYMKSQGYNYKNLHSTIYAVGKFYDESGELKFDEYHPIDYGFDFYAPQTTFDDKGRRLIVAWMDMWESEMPTQRLGHNWAGAMTLPREIVMKDNKLYFRPVEEIKKYRKNEFEIKNLELIEEITIDTKGDCYELDILIDAQEAKSFGIKVRASEKEETILEYNKENKLFKFNRDKSGIGPKGERATEAELIDNRLKLQIFVDKSSVEVFINDGEKVMTGRIYPSKESNLIKLFSKGRCRISYLYKWDIL